MAAESLAAKAAERVEARGEVVTEMAGAAEPRAADWAGVAVRAAVVVPWGDRAA